MTSDRTPHITGEAISRRVRTADWTIRYHEAGSGHPLILIHGSAPGTSGQKNFYPNIAPLAARFRVLAPDLPGWGDSDPAAPAVADHVGALVQFMDALDIEHAALLGSSMGGMVALRVAAKRPERVSHLIVCGAAGSSAPKTFSPAGMSEGLSAMLKVYQDPSPERMRDFYDVITFRPDTVPDDAVADRARGAASRQEHLENFLAGFAEPGYLPFSTADEIAAITAPTLLIHGRDDRVVHFENSLQLCTLITTGRLYLMNQCGHCPQLEHPEEFNRIVEQFASAV